MSTREQQHETALRDDRGNQYPPGLGIPELRTAVTDHQQRFYGLTFDPDTEVLVTVCATEAIAATMPALLEPGDEVIAFEPYYDSYAACISMVGATRVPLTLHAPDFRPDLDALRDAVTDRTRSGAQRPGAPRGPPRAQAACTAHAARCRRRRWQSAPSAAILYRVTSRPASAPSARGRWPVPARPHPSWRRWPTAWQLCGRPCMLGR